MPIQFISMDLVSLLLVIFLSILKEGACLRSSKPAEVSATTPLPTTTELPNYVEVLNCTENDTEKQDCRNKATCQKELNTKDKSFRLICLCTPGYQGPQCAERYRDRPAEVGPKPGELVSANTIAIAIAAAAVAIIVVVVVVIVCRLRSRLDQGNERLQRLRSQNQVQNGSATANGEAHENTKTPEREELLQMEEMKNNNSELAPV